MYVQYTQIERHTHTVDSVSNIFVNLQLGDWEIGTIFCGVKPAPNRRWNSYGLVNFVMVVDQRLIPSARKIM